MTPTITDPETIAMLQRFALALLLVCLWGGAPALGQPADEGGDAYTVTGVEVDVSAETTTAARDRAFAEGRRLAAAELFRRLGIEAVDPAGLESADLDRILQGFQVEEESLAPGRYIATLTYVFLPAEVRALARSRGAAAEAPRDSPVVLLPVYRDGAAARLWDAPNPWHQAWLDYEHGGQSAVPLVVPFGDVADVVDIDARRALAGDRPALAAIADRYGAEGTLVAVAEPGDGGLSVRLLPYGTGDAGPPAQLTVPEGTEPGLFPAAVERVAEQVDLSWFAAPAAAAGPENRLAVLVPLDSPADWFRTRSRLQRAVPVTDHTVISLSAREAVVELVYRGSETQLREALSRAGLQLREGTQAMELRALGGGDER
jgi:hypothetical protein